MLALINDTNTVQTVFYTVTPTSGVSGNCVGATFTVTVTLNPKPVIANTTAVICSGSSFTVTPTNVASGDIVPSGTTYTWTVVDNLSVSGESNQVTGQASISQILTNNSNIVQTVVYTVTPKTSLNCIGATFTVTVTVDPKPVISNKTTTICSGDTFTVTPLNVVGSDIVPSNTTYTWTVVSQANVTGEANETTPQSSISQALINDTNTVQTVVYTVTPTSGDSGNCVGATFTVTVTVNPKPVISNKPVYLK